MTTTTPEDLDVFALRAQRAGYSVAFVGADVTVNGKRPDFLCLPPGVADRFHELHPEATRLTLEGLQSFIENKVKAKKEAIEEKASAKET
jgi:hypothetical protein